MCRIARLYFRGNWRVRWIGRQAKAASEGTTSAERQFRGRPKAYRLEARGDELNNNLDNSEVLLVNCTFYS